MKTFLFFATFFFTQAVFANLYLTTEYQEAGKPSVVTKHHIFLNKKYLIHYSKMAYSLLLIKLEKDWGTIETETFVLDNKARKHLISGGIANFNLGKKPIILEQFARSGKREFMLKITPDRIAP